MKNEDARTRVIEYLEKMARKNRTLPQEFTPKEIASETDAYAPQIGAIAKDVVRHLKDRGIKAKYEDWRNPKRFVIEPAGIRLHGL